MTSPVDPGRLAGLRGHNIVVGLILIVQAVAVVALSNDFTLSGHRRLRRGATRDSTQGGPTRIR